MFEKRDLNPFVLSKPYEHNIEYSVACLTRDQHVPGSNPVRTCMYTCAW